MLLQSISQPSYIEIAKGKLILKGYRESVSE